MKIYRHAILKNLLVFSQIGITAGLPSLSFGAIVPEKRSLQLSNQLKGVSDDRWLAIAGERSKEKIEIIKGDTLSGISKRLFGDPNYWPKIWEINNESVKNPHFIYPGNALYFSPGTANSLPSIEVDEKGQTLGTKSPTQTNENGEVVQLSESSKALTESVSVSYSSANDGPGPVYDERTPRPPSEWKKLPRQSWENTVTKLAPTVDKDGFDFRNRQTIKRTTGLEQDYYLACEPLNPIGSITGGRKPGQFLDNAEEVTLESSQKLEAGEVYSILGSRSVTMENDGRRVESYSVAGRVKVLGVNDGIYLGELKGIQSMAERGDLIVPNIPRVQRVNPIAGPAPIEAKIFLDSRYAPNITAQYKWVYIDRGSTDGVKPGMVFRFFQYKDPNNNKDLTTSNMLVQGDVEIYQSCGGFSLGQIVWSRSTVTNDTPAILLTDVQDYYTRLYLNGNMTPNQMVSPETKKEGDWLDDLDNGQDLTSEEDQELQQLEKVDDAAAQSEEPTVPTLEGEDQLTAPPPEAAHDLPAPEELPLDTAIPPEVPEAITPEAPPVESEPSDLAL
jgi:hypothetical protein